MSKQYEKKIFYFSEKHWKKNYSEIFYDVGLYYDLQKMIKEYLPNYEWSCRNIPFQIINIKDDKESRIKTKHKKIDLNSDMSWNGILSMIKMKTKLNFNILDYKTVKLWIEIKHREQPNFYTWRFPLDTIYYPLHMSNFHYDMIKKNWICSRLRVTFCL